MIRAAPTLLPQSAADTVVALAARDGLSLATDLAIIAGGLALVLLLLAAVALALQAARALKELREGVNRSLGPVTDQARVIAENLSFITQALRSDVERLNQSVKALTDRLQQASDRMEERIEEFNALMEVVQHEAEDLFIDTASAVRGVRAGARAIARPPPPDDGETDEALPAEGEDDPDALEAPAHSTSVPAR